MITIVSTGGCGRTPALVFALEESGLEYGLESVADGMFARDYWTNGPMLRDGDFEALEMDAITRYIGRLGGIWPEDLMEAARADRFVEMQSIWIRPNFVRGKQLRDVSREASEAAYATARRGLQGLDHWLGRSPWATDKFTAADCPSLVLRIAPRCGLPLDEFSNLTAYLDRLEARPALARARARIEAHGSD